jgi:hypothetical protein
MTSPKKKAKITLEENASQVEGDKIDESSSKTCKTLAGVKPIKILIWNVNGLRACIKVHNAVFLLRVIQCNLFRKMATSISRIQMLTSYFFKV